MNKIGMNYGGYNNYSRAGVTNNQNQKNDKETPVNLNSYSQAPSFKGEKKQEPSGFKKTFGNFMASLGLTKKIKKEEVQEPKPIEWNGLDKKSADILYERWNDKNGGIKSVQNRCYRGDEFSYVEFNDETTRHLPAVIDTEENIVSRLKEMDLPTLLGNYNMYEDSLVELYGKSISKFSKEIKQPKEPVIIDKADFKTKPTDKDNFMRCGDYTRAEVAKILRFGQNSLINKKKSIADSILYTAQYRLGVENPQISDIRAIKRYGKENDTYIYYDKNTNLTTIFDEKGFVIGQVAFDTKYKERGDEMPSDYKMYSFGDGHRLKQFI